MGSWCVCVGLGFASIPPFSGLGVGASGLLRAQRRFPATFWWGYLWRGGVRGLPWVGFVPPLPFCFFSGCGGGDVVFGPVVLWLCGVCHCLSRSWVSWSLSPPPLSFGLRPCFFFCPPLLQLGLPACPGCPFLRWAAALGWVSPGFAGRSSGVLWGGPMGVAFGVARLGGLPSSCGVGARLAAVCLSLAPPFFFRVRCLLVFLFFFCFLGGVCLFLPQASLGWCTHWLAFGVANRVAVGACAWLGRAPAPWVGWVMYTLGLMAFPVGLGSGSAGWAVAPGCFVRSWVKGDGVFRVTQPLWCRL